MCGATPFPLNSDIWRRRRYPAMETAAGIRRDLLTTCTWRDVEEEEEDEEEGVEDNVVLKYSNFYWMTEMLTLNVALLILGEEELLNISHPLAEPEYHLSPSLWYVTPP